MRWEIINKIWVIAFCCTLVFLEDFAGSHLSTGEEPFRDNAGSRSAFLPTLLSWTGRRQFKSLPARSCLAPDLPCAAAESAEQQDSARLKDPGVVGVCSVQHRSSWVSCPVLVLGSCTGKWKHVKMKKEEIWALWLGQAVWGLSGCITLTPQGTEFHFSQEILPTLYFLSCSKVPELNSVTKQHQSCRFAEGHFIGRVEKSGEIQ